MNAFATELRFAPWWQASKEEKGGRDERQLQSEQ